MRNEQRPREIGETIASGDTCRTVDGYSIPAANSIGRLVRKESFGYVHTTQAHTPESLHSKEQRLRSAPTETYEVIL